LNFLNIFFLLKFKKIALIFMFRCLYTSLMFRCLHTRVKNPSSPFKLEFLNILPSFQIFHFHPFCTVSVELVKGIECKKNKKLDHHRFKTFSLHIIFLSVPLPRINGQHFRHYSYLTLYLMHNNKKN